MPKRTCVDCDWRLWLKEFQEARCVKINDGRFIPLSHLEIPDWCPFEDEPKDRWISVKDELPSRATQGGICVNYSEYVLIYVKHGEGCNIAFYDFDKKGWTGKYIYAEGIITHWMFLPHPPEKKKCPTCGHEL